MRFIIVSLAAGAIVGIILGMYVSTVLSDNLKISMTPPATSTPAVVQTKPSTGGSSTTTSTGNFVPSGFQGPTSAPHIIGPKSNPPNY